MDKVIVTGGLGIIGAYICRALLSTNRQPVIYDITSDTRLASDVVRDCVVERGDVRDLPRFLAVAQAHKPLGILHFAGKTGPDVEEFPWTSLHSNLMGTMTAFEVARLAGIPKVVFPSSKTVYGDVDPPHRHPTYEPVTEDYRHHFGRYYARMKSACESFAHHYAPHYKLDIIALRFGSVYGPGKTGMHDKVNPVMAAIEHAVAGRPYKIGFGAEQSDDLGYCGECANGVLAALDAKPRPGEFRAYNISSAELISFQKILDTLKELHPGWQAEAGPGLDYRRYGVGAFFLMSIDKAKKELGFKPKFTFRTAAIDYAETLGRLNKSNS